MEAGRARVRNQQRYFYGLSLLIIALLLTVKIFRHLRHLCSKVLLLEIRSFSNRVFIITPVVDTDSVLQEGFTFKSRRSFEVWRKNSDQSQSTIASKTGSFRCVLLGFSCFFVLHVACTLHIVLVSRNCSIERTKLRVILACFFLKNYSLGFF